MTLRSVTKLASLQQQAQSVGIPSTTTKLPAYLLAGGCARRVCALLSAKAGTAEVEPDKATLAWMQSVLGNWEAACRRHVVLKVKAENS